MENLNLLERRNESEWSKHVFLYVLPSCAHWKKSRKVILHNLPKLYSIYCTWATKVERYTQTDWQCVKPPKLEKSYIFLSVSRILENDELNEWMFYYSLYIKEVIFFLNKTRQPHWQNKWFEEKKMKNAACKSKVTNYKNLEHEELCPSD